MLLIEVFELPLKIPVYPQPIDWVLTIMVGVLLLLIFSLLGLGLGIRTYEEEIVKTKVRLLTITGTNPRLVMQGFFQSVALVMEEAAKERFENLPKEDPTSKPTFITSVQIPKNVRGLICTRTWFIWSAYLHSQSADYIWKRNEEKADTMPSRENFNGIYALQLPAVPDNCTDILGIVEMKGKILVHRDSVVRAEYCKVHLLIVDSRRIDKQRREKISSLYKVPILTVSQDADEYLTQWVQTPEGMYWMKHNYDVLNPPYNILDEAESILRKEDS